MKMKTSYIGVILTFLMLMSGAFRASAQEPKLRLSTKDLFLGKGKASETLTDSITIYNDGDADLRINRIFTGCMCTTALYPRETIAPGDSMNVTLKYHYPSQPPGKFRKLIRVRSNDPSSPTRFFITGLILPNRIDE